jgi:anti-sigma regulatory factor (Ser/Thr protein kinase)
MNSPSHQTVVISVTDASAVGHARRNAVSLAEKLGFDEVQRGELALIVTEAGTNLLQHAGGGELLLRALVHDTGVEVLALDKGPGMADVSQCLRDGYSTGGSRGAGLGSIARLADHFDVYSREGKGTALLARCFARSRGAPAAARAEHGAICVAYPGEEVSGDGWSVDDRPGFTSVLMVDGLGHGLQAAESAQAAIQRFEEHATKGPAAVLESIHRALHGMRGAAGAALTIDWIARTVRFAGIGNISGSLISDRRSRGLSSHNGILGQSDPRFQEFEYPWPLGGLLVVHSDGISTRWSLDASPELAAKDPSLIAAVLYRDFSRRDDLTALVLRESSREMEAIVS